MAVRGGKREAQSVGGRKIRRGFVAGAFLIYGEGLWGVGLSPKRDQKLSRAGVVVE
jgi:hypothetical protein